MPFVRKTKDDIELAMIRENNLKKGRFKPGDIGNPHGHNQLTKKAKERLKDASEVAIDKLIERMQADGDKDQYDAIKTIIDRVYGKATQPMIVDEDSNVTHVIIDRHDEEEEKPELKVIEGKAKEG